MKRIHITLNSIVLVPFIFASCATTAGTAVAGAATYKAIDDHQEQEQREDYAKTKAYQNNKQNKNRQGNRH